jgi:hypothetical protein
LLDLIEKVDPRNFFSLEEIETKFWNWYLQRNDVDSSIISCFPFDDYLGFDENRYISIITNDNIKYLDTRVTTSRDALKSIRPKGWQIQITTFDERQCSAKNKCSLCSITDYKKEFNSPVKNFNALPTEELAELHAIIQAIEFERTRK